MPYEIIDLCMDSVFASEQYLEMDVHECADWKTKETNWWIEKNRTVASIRMSNGSICESDWNRRRRWNERKNRFGFTFVRRSWNRNVKKVKHIFVSASLNVLLIWFGVLSMCFLFRCSFALIFNSDCVSRSCNAHSKVRLRAELCIRSSAKWSQLKLRSRTHIC